MYRSSAVILAAVALIVSISGCSNSRTMVDRNMDMSTYRYATVYDSDFASFIELELESMMQSLGYETIGEKEAQRRFQRKGHVLGVRYVRTHINSKSVLLRVLIEDQYTGKTILTVEDTQKDGLFEGAIEKSWKSVRRKLVEVLEDLNANGFVNR
jgi:hypothetical protein